MHKDEASMLKAICERLKVGRVNVGAQFATFIVSSEEDLLNIFSIFDKTSLNTFKNLNYLCFRKGYQL